MQRRVVVRIDYVRKDLEVVCKKSKGVGNRVYQEIQKVQENPRSYRTLTLVPDDISCKEGVFLRKIKVVNKKQDVRMVYLHLEREEEDRVFFVYVSDRKDDYRSLNWDLIRDILGDERP